MINLALLRWRLSSTTSRGSFTTRTRMWPSWCLTFIMDTKGIENSALTIEIYCKTFRVFWPRLVLYNKRFHLLLLGKVLEVLGNNMAFYSVAWPPWCQALSRKTEMFNISLWRKFSDRPQLPPRHKNSSPRNEWILCGVVSLVSPTCPHKSKHPAAYIVTTYHLRSVVCSAQLLSLFCQFKVVVDREKGHPPCWPRLT